MEVPQLRCHKWLVDGSQASTFSPLLLLIIISRPHDHFRQGGMGRHVSLKVYTDRGARVLVRGRARSFFAVSEAMSSWIG